MVDQLSDSLIAGRRIWDEAEVEMEQTHLRVDTLQAEMTELASRYIAMAGNANDHERLDEAASAITRKELIYYTTTFIGVIDIHQSPCERHFSSGMHLYRRAVSEVIPVDPGLIQEWAAETPFNARLTALQEFSIDLRDLADRLHDVGRRVGSSADIHLECTVLAGESLLLDLAASIDCCVCRTEGFLSLIHGLGV